MELSLSGNALKTFNRSITSLARVGTELVIQASSSQLELHTINSSRSAYQSITFKPDLFDAFNLNPSSSNLVQCSVLLKSVCSILRTPISNVDRLSAVLPSDDSPKLQWTLQCYNGVKKTYWISCNVEPDIQQLSIDKRRFPSSFVVKPRDLTRLLSNFQSSLQEITVIATEPSAVPSVPSDAAAEIGGKAVELRSYIDPTKDNSDSALHTQLWIDPSEEFVQYTHVGDAVDVTFGVKELKAFLSFCEGCEVDIHLFFEKAGEPILMAPRFGLDDGAYSDFDATLVLATMLTSQLCEEANTTDHPRAGAASVKHAQDTRENGSRSERARPSMPPAGSEHSSDHTKIWSDLSGSAARSADGNRDKEAQTEGNQSSMQNDVQMPDIRNSSKVLPARDGIPDIRHPLETNHQEEPQDRADINGNPYSQRHPSNWVGEGDDDEEDDEGELYVQSTPQIND